MDESKGDKRDKSNPNNKTNFLVVPEQGKCTIVLNAYKTQGKYGYNHHYPLSDFASALTRRYMNRKNRTYGDYIFGDTEQSHFVGDKIGKLLESEMPEGVKKITINTLRRMSASEAELDTPEKMYAFSKKMLHGVHTQGGYIGNVAKKQTTLNFKKK